MDSIVAIAAAEESVETTWVVKIVDQNVVARETKDFYGNVASAGQSYLKGYFLEKQTITAKGYFYKIYEKSHTIYFKESIVFPFV